MLRTILSPAGVKLPLAVLFVDTTMDASRDGINRVSDNRNVYMHDGPPDVSNMKEFVMIHIILTHAAVLVG